MNFIEAIQHATIGYGIRRECWIKSAALRLESGKLFWFSPPGHSNVARGLEAELLGEDSGISLTGNDFVATDWEIINAGHLQQPKRVNNPISLKDSFVIQPGLYGGESPTPGSVASSTADPKPS